MNYPQYDCNSNSCSLFYYYYFSLPKQQQAHSRPRELAVICRKQTNLLVAKTYVRQGTSRCINICVYAVVLCALFAFFLHILPSCSSQYEISLHFLRRHNCLQESNNNNGSVIESK